MKLRPCASTKALTRVGPQQKVEENRPRTDLLTIQITHRLIGTLFNLLSARTKQFSSFIARSFFASGMRVKTHSRRKPTSDSASSFLPTSNSFDSLQSVLSGVERDCLLLFASHRDGD